MVKIEEACKLMLTEYPDILDAKQTAEILGIEKHKVYKLIEWGELYAVKPGTSYKIAKISLIQYLLGIKAA